MIRKPLIIYPALTDSYQGLRATLGKSEPPLTVIVTTPRGAPRLHERELPPSVQIATVAGAERLSGRAILDAVRHFSPSDVILVEGGRS